jgi:hypothetical protein
VSDRSLIAGTFSGDRERRGSETEANELLNKLAEDIINPEALMDIEMASSDR